MENNSEEDLFARSPAIAVNGGDERKGFKLKACVELPLFLIMFGAAMAGTPVTNILMYRTCVHSLGYPLEECRSFLKPGRASIPQDVENAVQKYATFVSTVQSVLESLLPAVLSLFMVVWSDKHGRKPLIVRPMLGLTLSSMMIVAYSMMDFLGPWWIIASSIPYSLSGGFVIMMTGAMCYVTDISSEQSRSIKITIVQAMFAGGMAGGALASSHLLRAVGSVYLLLIVSSMFAVSYAFTAVCLEESVLNAQPGSISSMLDFSHVTHMFQECFKRRPNRLRAQMLLLITAYSFSIFIIFGIPSLVYLYTRAVLNWGLNDYTQYSAISIGISFTGSFLGVAVIQKLLKISDLALAIVGFLSTAGEYFVKGFAVVSRDMYIGSTISLFGGLSTPLIRSLITKILPASDTAKVFGLMCAIDGVCMVTAPVVYNALYAATVASMPGTVMVFTSALSVTSAVVLGVVAFYRWHSSRSNYAQFQDEET